LVPMKLTFHGAVRSVTGSRHLIETEGNRVLLDRVFFSWSATREHEERSAIAILTETGRMLRQLEDVRLSVGTTHHTHDMEKPELASTDFSRPRLPGPARRAPQRPAAR
jgi:hypothetical protein